MATVRKRGDKWRAEVSRLGIRRSATFATKREAQQWAAEIEADALSGLGKKVRGDKTLTNALERFRDEVSPTHRGHRRELITLNKWASSHALRGARIDMIQSSQIAAWRDTRLQEVQPSTVSREMTLLRSVFESARRDWGWIAANPFDDVRRPPSTRARDRRPTAREIDALRDALGFDEELPPKTQSARVAVGMLFSIETAMRQGEILSLEWPVVDLGRRVALLDITKNGDARAVPLTTEAVRLLRIIKALDLPGSKVWQVSAGNFDALWRRARDRCGIDDLHFHDMRAEALTRLSKKVDVLTLARISGHRDIKQLMTYYRESAEDIAARLD